MAHSKPQSQTRIENLRAPIMKYKHIMPKMLLYGDSHIVRLEEWINQPYKKSNIFGPTPLDHVALSNIEVCAVEVPASTRYMKKCVEWGFRLTKNARETSGIIL